MEAAFTGYPLNPFHSRLFLVNKKKGDRGLEIDFWK